MSQSPEKTYGLLLLGAFFSSVLFGLTSLQSIIYFRIYSLDPKFLKITVLIVWILDSVHTAFVWDATWFYLVQNFGDESKIQDINPSIPESCIFTGIITFITQSFYVYRIFHLSNRRYWIVVPIISLAFIRMAGVFLASAVMLRNPTFSAVLPKYSWTVTFSLTLACIIDILIIFSMFVLLRKSRQDSITLDKVIDFLILYTFEMGLLTGCVALVTMICWIGVPNKLVFLGIDLPIAKLYANSLLAALNVRCHLRGLQKASSTNEWVTNMTVQFSNGSDRVKAEESGELEEEDSQDPRQKQIKINMHRKVEYHGRDDAFTNSDNTY